jgi:hypothetical protein
MLNAETGWEAVIFRDYGIMVAVGLAYLVSHFLLYVGVLRNRSLFRSEYAIFLYHFVSATLFGLMALLVALTHFSDASLAIGVGLIAAHCIYSLSFLELWTLAEGSYSMSILTGIDSQGTLSRKTLVDAFTCIGDAKKGNRLSVLLKLSLACRKGAHWQLSARGRIVASVVNLLVWLAAIKNRG